MKIWLFLCITVYIEFSAGASLYSFLLCISCCPYNYIQQLTVSYTCCVGLYVFVQKGSAWTEQLHFVDVFNKG